MYEDDRITDYHIDNGWWDITSVGEWDGSAGGKPAKFKITQQNLVDMASSYNPELREAPVTLDHWDMGRAYAWVKELRVAGDKLQAKLKLVSDELREWLKTGAYRSRSIMVFRPLESTGKDYLGHVAFLGAANPAAEGLQPVPHMLSQGGRQAITTWLEAANEGDKVVCLESNTESSEKEETTMDEKSIIEKITHNLKEFFSSRDDQAAQLAEAQQNIAELKDQTANLEADLSAEKTRADTAEAKLAEHGQAAELAEFSGKLEESVPEKITPAERDSYLELGKQLDATGRAAILKAVNAKAATGLLTEHSAKEKKDTAAASKAKREDTRFNGFPEDPEHKAARELQAADSTLSFQEAITQVRQQKAAQPA